MMMMMIWKWPPNGVVELLESELTVRPDIQLCSVDGDYLTCSPSINYCKSGISNWLYADAGFGFPKVEHGLPITLISNLRTGVGK